jgi:hypothetical protein
MWVSKTRQSSDRRCTGTTPGSQRRTHGRSGRGHDVCRQNGLAMESELRLQTPCLDRAEPGPCPRPH